MGRKIIGLETVKRNPLYSQIMQKNATRVLRDLSEWLTERPDLTDPISESITLNIVIWPCLHLTSEQVASSSIKPACPLCREHGSPADLSVFFEGIEPLEIAGASELEQQLQSILKANREKVIRFETAPELMPVTTLSDADAPLVISSAGGHIAGLAVEWPYVVFARPDKQIQVWDIARSRSLRMAYPAQMTALALAHGLLVFGVRNGSLEAMDLKRSGRVSLLSQFDEKKLGARVANSIQVTPTGIIAGFQDGSIGLWRITPERIILHQSRVPSPRDYFSDVVTLSSESHRGLCIAAGKDWLRIIELQTGHIPKEVTFEPVVRQNKGIREENEVKADWVDEDTIAYGTYFGEVGMCNLKTDSKIILKSSAENHLITFSVSPTRIAAGFNDGAVLVWQKTDSGEFGPPHAIAGAHTDVVRAIIFDGPDRMITAGFDKKIIFWRVTAHGFEQERTITVPEGVLRLTYVAGQKLLIAALKNGGILLLR